MANKTVPAIIRWLTPEEGGRARPPSGPTYSTVAIFEGVSDAWSRASAWSLVLEYEEWPDPHSETKASVGFLVDNGPEPWLKAGARFELYEGRMLVARGEVVE